MPGNEKHTYIEDEIVQLLKDIYRHAMINSALCAELGLDAAVVSLMKRIPYFTDSSTSKYVEFFEYSRAIVYLEDEEVQGGRDPDLFEVQEPRLDHLLPWEIALICTGDEGKNVILDTRENTIRVEDFLYGPPGRDAPADYEYSLERTNEKRHYRNYYAHHASTWLAEW
ncbi:hypothetical protein BJX65DRAFT_307555 [Aspergillus insuetus]